MKHSFSTVKDGTRYVWDIDKLWLESESLDSIDWDIPSSFKDEWWWGKSHPSEHIERCLKADLSYPILVWDGSIIDGCHRTVMALVNGESSIKAKVIVEIPDPDDETDLVEEESNEGVYWTHEDMLKIIKAVRSYDYDSK